MGSRTLNLTIVVFWLSTMSWLIVAKVLPPLLIGDPPNYRKIQQTQGDQKPFGWTISLNNRPLGWAISQTGRRADDMIVQRNRIFLSQVEVDKLAPAWVGAMLYPALRSIGSLSLSVGSEIVFDPLGRLTAFSSTIHVEKFESEIMIRGVVKGKQLTLEFRSQPNDILLYTLSRPLNPDLILCDETSPLSHLPGLHVGQKWTLPVYSPLRPTSSACEILQAEVESTDHLVWNNTTVPTVVVAFRADAGASLYSTQEIRSKLWIRDDGLVLRQDVNLMNLLLRFQRMSDDAVATTLDTLGARWADNQSTRVGRQVLEQLP